MIEKIKEKLSELEVAIEQKDEKTAKKLLEEISKEAKRLLSALQEKPKKRNAS